MVLDELWHQGYQAPLSQEPFCSNAMLGGLPPEAFIAPCDFSSSFSLMGLSSLPHLRGYPREMASDSGFQSWLHHWAALDPFHHLLGPQFTYL